jgi:hypothetical protein
LPGIVVLLKAELQLAMLFEIDEASFAFDRVRWVVAYLDMIVPVPGAAFPSGRPYNVLLQLC